MLKRYQVLLEDWLADYIKHLAKTYDVSFSETIRLSLCSEYLNMAIVAYNYKSKMNIAKVAKILKETMKSKYAVEDQHKLISKIYFEARKAIEFRLTKEKP